MDDTDDEREFEKSTLAARCDDELYGTKNIHLYL